MDQVIERVRVPLWAWLVVIGAALGVYLLSYDNGLVLRAAAEGVHEFLHDGRHFLGVPCH